MCVPVLTGLDYLAFDLGDYLRECFYSILCWWVRRIKVQLFLGRFDSCFRRSRLFGNTSIALTHSSADGKMCLGSESIVLDKIDRPRSICTSMASVSSPPGRLLPCSVICTDHVIQFMRIAEVSREHIIQAAILSPSVALQTLP